MKPQIYDLETKFNFGKHIGKSLREVIYNRESRYIGYLIANDILWFILDPETMNFLDKKGFFNDLDMSLYTGGGCFTLSEIGYTKEDILALLKKRFDDFTNDPIAYEKLANEKLQEYSNSHRFNLNKT
jgi:hypothetical protein